MDTSHIEALIGNWMGPSTLFLDEDRYESDSTADVRFVGQRKFIAFAYTWQWGDKPQDGLILIPTKLGPEPAVAPWLDSWHLQTEIMVCEATQDPEGIISLLGSYPAPPGPDWGWRIEVTSPVGGMFDLRMYNLTPPGQEVLAVHTQYRKDGAGGFD